MSLTGPVFLSLVVLTALAAFAAAVYWWPRLSRPSVPTVAARDQPCGGGRRSRGRPSSAPSSQPALPLPPAGERILRYTVTGPVGGISAPVMVELPAGYTAPENRARRYPVLETFHGVPGDISQWIDGMDLGGQVAATVARHQMSDVVIVSPSIEIPRGRDTECVNGSLKDPAVEAWLTQDVPSWLLQTFRVRPDRAAWSTIGLSAGGWCAAMATMLHPDRYASAIVLGGYFRPEFSRTYLPFPPRSTQSQRYDLITLAHDHPPSVALWVETSHSDPISYPSASLLLKQAKPPLSVTSVVLAHAGHRMSLWQGLLPQALAWLGANVPGFAA